MEFCETFSSGSKGTLCTVYNLCIFLIFNTRIYQKQRELSRKVTPCLLQPLLPVVSRLRRRLSLRLWRLWGRSQDTLYHGHLHSSPVSDNIWTREHLDCNDLKQCRDAEFAKSSGQWYGTLWHISLEVLFVILVVILVKSCDIS